MQLRFCELVCRPNDLHSQEMFIRQITSQEHGRQRRSINSASLSDCGSAGRLSVVTGRVSKSSRVCIKMLSFSLPYPHADGSLTLVFVIQRPAQHKLNKRALSTKIITIKRSTKPDPFKDRLRGKSHHTCDNTQAKCLHYACKL